MWVPLFDVPPVACRCRQVCAEQYLSFGEGEEAGAGWVEKVRQPGTESLAGPGRAGEGDIPSVCVGRVSVQGRWFGGNVEPQLACVEWRKEEEGGGWTVVGCRL